MRIFRNKFLIKLIASICILLTMFNFGTANKVYAEDELWGGVLIKPIINLLSAIGDTIMEILHQSVQEQGQALIKIDGTDKSSKAWIMFGIVVIAIVAAALIIAASVGGAAIAAAVAAKVGATVAIKVGSGVLAGGILGGVLVGYSLYKAWIPEDLYLPAFSLTPEKIFSNEILLFDVNFFNPMEPIETPIYTTENKEVTFNARTLVSTQTTNPYGEEWSNLAQELRDYAYSVPTSTYYNNDRYPGVNYIFSLINGAQENGESIDFNTDQYYVIPYDLEGNEFEVYIDTIDNSRMYTINIYYTGNENGATATLNIEQHAFTINTTVTTQTGVDVIQSTAARLQGIISTWYFILRNIAIIVLMLVLIFTGVKIVIGSTAGEKAKYKERLMDWLVALCLLMIMHYIMVFALEINERILNLVDNINGSNDNFAYIPLTDKQYENAKKVFEIEDIGPIKNEGEERNYWRNLS